VTKTLILNTGFDLNVLFFLWKWKVSTTKAIHTGVGSDRALERVYRRLVSMERHKFIRTHAPELGKAKVWALDQRGFQTIQGRLPRLIESGYRSEHLGHDLFCHAIHLGEWLSGPPSGCDIFSEQQLRRVDMDFYPSWVPRTPTHRPDGWWQIQKGGEKKLAALEVELSLKDAANYETLGEFFSESIKVESVVWLVSAPFDGNYIHRHLMRGIRDGSDDHSFIFVPDFLQHGWQSPIRIGKNVGQTLSQILHPTSAPPPPQGVGNGLFDVRKKPMKPIGNLSPKLSDFL
jgi:hypothetical protein